MENFVDALDIDSKVELTPHLVAYIDILGGKNKIYSDANFSTLNNVRALYNEIVEQIDLNKSYNTRYIDINIFSDNILISSKAHVETPKIIKRTIVHFFKIIQEIQYNALARGILLRGGIDYGKLYIDTNFVWGEALINAYELEQKAIFPRIILSQNAQDFLQRIDTRFRAISLFGMLPLGTDNDNFVYIDYLGKWQNTSEDLIKLEYWTDFLRDEINNCFKDCKIMEKLNWLRYHHNLFCEFQEMHEYLIEEN